MSFDHEDFKKCVQEASSVEEVMKLNMELLIQVGQMLSAPQYKPDQRLTEDAIQNVLQAIKDPPISLDWTFVPPVIPDTLIEIFKAIEAQDLMVSYIVMNPVDYADIRKFGRDHLDVEDQYVYLKRGAMAYLWGAVFIMTTSLTPGDVRVITQTGGTLKVFSFKVER